MKTVLEDIWEEINSEYTPLEEKIGLAFCVALFFSLLFFVIYALGIRPYFGDILNILPK